ncbi:MAG: PspA/IM30 family protein, partial [Gemmatimonadota bacterium]
MCEVDRAEHGGDYYIWRQLNRTERRWFTTGAPGARAWLDEVIPHMGIFDRFSTLLRSNINDLISRAENPEKMLNQLIVDMKSSLAKAKQEVAGAIADEKKLQADAEALKKQSEDWERRAMLAVQEGRDDMA